MNSEILTYDEQVHIRAWIESCQAQERDLSKEIVTRFNDKEEPIEHYTMWDLNQILNN